MESGIQGIYLIERITQEEGERYYVGKSVNVFERWLQHCCVKRPTQHIDQELKRIGACNFKFSILEKVKKESQLKKCESKWIKYYREKCSDSQLYNRSETQNRDPLEPQKKEIRNMLYRDLGQSIYPIAKKYKVSWTVVVDVRKPLLKKAGLKYDNKIKNVVDIKTHEAPKDWRGGNFTKEMADKVRQDKDNGFDNKNIARRNKISTSDIDYFFSLSEEKLVNYQYAKDL